MKKETAEKILKIFGVLRYIGGALLILLAIFLFVSNVPEFNDQFTKAIKDAGLELNGMKPNILLGSILAGAGIGIIFTGWVLRRAANGKTTLALVLSILAVISAVATLFKADNLIGQLGSLAIEALLLYSVITVRKDA